jgi:hypoxanthine phosphoribosyltransferase
MSQNPYDYSTRQGIYPIAWDDFHGLCKALAKGVSAYRPEVILPIGRGGFYPGTLISHLLQVEVYPVRVSRRVNDVVQYNTPQWRQEPPALVRDKRVLIVDEICGTGETIGMVKEKVMAMGAAEARSAVLYAHSWGTEMPDYLALVTDALLINPWDREIFREGEFLFSPEYADALRQQGVEPDASLLIPATPFELAKG